MVIPGSLKLVRNPIWHRQSSRLLHQGRESGFRTALTQKSAQRDERWRQLNVMN
jgi:hypothetical protein